MSKIFKTAYIVSKLSLCIWDITYLMTASRYDDTQLGICIFVRGIWLQLEATMVDVMA